MGISTYFNLFLILILGLIWIGIIAFLRLKKKKSFVYLIFFTVFYIYIVKVLDLTLFQFQSLIILKYFNPNLMLNGETASEALNLIPLITLDSSDIQTSLLNILLFIPFGFGLLFITNFRMKKVVVTGIIFSIAIELLQLLSGVIAGITFRVADINDVIFNTLGIGIGYILFIGFIKIFHDVFRDKEIKNPILKYIDERPHVEKPVL